MALVNVSDVRTIIDTQLEDSVISEFVNIADRIVTDYLSNTNLSDVTKKEIERWLTAHLISISRERQTKSEKVGDAQVSFSAVGNGAGLATTTYGSMVLTLDSSHTLEKIDKKEPVLYAVKSFDDE